MPWLAGLPLHAGIEDSPDSLQLLARVRLPAANRPDVDAALKANGLRIEREPACSTTSSQTGPFACRKP